MNLAEALPYLNARLRARKSRLLGAARLRELAAADSAPTALGRLADSPYGPALRRASAGEADTALTADAAFGRALAEDLAQVRGFSQELAASPARYLFAAWDLANLKAVLRGVRGGAAPEAMLVACSPAGFLPEAVWAELAGSAGLAEAVARASTMELGFRPGLREGWADYSRSENPADLEAALDRHFYREARESLESVRGALWVPLRELVAFDIDLRNFLALLEGIGRLEGPSAAPLPGGRHTDEVFLRRLEAADAPLSLLAGRVRVWLRAPGEVAARLLDAGRPEAAAGALERAGWRERSRRLRGPPLSLDLLIGYVWAKASEVADLRRIVWGLHMGLSAAWIDDGLLTA